MSSREIAELTGKEHRNVMRDIRALLEALEMDVLSFERISHDAYGRPQPIFNLPKDHTTTLVAGYSIPMRHRIVTRWMELEGAVQRPALPTDYLSALKQLVDSTERAQAAEKQVLELTHKAQVDAPKVLVFDSVIAERP